jgi:hypothetical protein
MSGINFVLITAILNRQVYDKTVTQCNADGSNCTGIDDAPVCQFLDKGKLNAGAQLISTYDPTSTSAVQDEITPLKNCDGLFAGCMTAPCAFTKNGQAECSCPVFYGHFQLVGADARCDLGGDLVPSASYNPSRDPTVP